MHRGAWFIATLATGCALVVAGCGGDDNGGSSSSSSGSSGGEKPGKVAVLLPDSKSSVRWETVDRPLLKQAFDAAGVENEIQNAEGDKSTQQQQAEQAITNGAKVLLPVDELLLEPHAATPNDSAHNAPPMASARDIGEWITVLLLLWNGTSV